MPVPSMHDGCMLTVLQALEFGASELFDVEFHGILPLSGDRPTAVRVDLDGTQWSVSSASSTDYTATWPIRVRNYELRS